MTTTARRSGGELKQLDETVVEVSTIGELDIVHLLQQRHGAGSLPHAEKGHLRPLARDVAGTHDAEHWQFGHETEPYGARRREVAAKRSGKQHLSDVARLEASVLEQQMPARRDGRFGELQLADVPLREIDGRFGGASLVEDAHALCSHLREPRSNTGSDTSRFFLGHQSPRSVEKTE